MGTEYSHTVPRDIQKSYRRRKEAFLTKVHRSVQPSAVPSKSQGSISTMAMGNIKNDPFTEETISISTRSDTSADTHIFDTNIGAIRPGLYPRKDAVLRQSSMEQSQGKLHIRIKYDFRTSDVLVHLIEAQELLVDKSREHEGGFGDPCIRINMVPEVDEITRQSSVKRRAHNPFYNEYFKFPVTVDEVKERTLIFQVFDYDKFSRHKTMREVRVDLGQVDVTNSVEMWCDIQKQSQVRLSVFDVLASNYI
ncbi:synaptotagmin-6-like [Ostrea edulis]|uniref:synaptotagmin-6-like n=1 Tax=Ostrea edulis TaxID=37623 RepID=UPI0024AEA5B3|nr:synaptotagmin-6-like [Ostrea edulis]